MFEEEISQCMHERIAVGQHELAHAMRLLMRRVAPQIFDVVRDLDDAVFLEPALFMRFARVGQVPPFEVPQIIVGRVPVEARPDAVEIDTDQHGRAYLPGLGVFLTDRRATSLILSWDHAGGHHRLFDGHHPVPFALEPETKIEGTDIELVRYEDPMLRTLFLDDDRNMLDVEIDGLAELHRSHIEKAIDLLREHCPIHFAELARVTRRIAVFRGQNMSSFSSLNAHGIVFIHALDTHDELHFIEELLHQCGHIAFNAMTVRRREFLATDPRARLSELIGDPSEHRRLYSAFHGLYVQDTSTECMRVLDERRVFSGQQRHELSGRLASLARMFKHDVRTMSAPGLFTPLGAELHRRWKIRSENLERDRPDLWTYDLSGQPYSFDAALFAKLNPMPVWESRQVE